VAAEWQQLFDRTSRGDAGAEKQRTIRARLATMTPGHPAFLIITSAQVMGGTPAEVIAAAWEDHRRTAWTTLPSVQLEGEDLEAFGEATAELLDMLYQQLVHGGLLKNHKLVRQLVAVDRRRGGRLGRRSRANLARHERKPPRSWREVSAQTARAPHSASLVASRRCAMCEDRWRPPEPAGVLGEVSAALSRRQRTLDEKHERLAELLRLALRMMEER
jgi:hypothetical protein